MKFLTLPVNVTSGVIVKKSPFLVGTKHLQATAKFS